MKIGKVSVPLYENNGLFTSVDNDYDEKTITFGEMLSSAISEVNDLQRVAVEKNTDMVAGRVEDIAEVMIAAEKASLALQLTNQVRNKVVDAYQEIMRMSM